MGTLVMIGQLILALAILVSLHEWGHYIAARKFGIRVEKFFIFFDAWGVKLFSKKIKDTEWGIGWLPLGGYVKIAGMIDESLDKEQLKSEPKSDEFRGKPAWQRLIVMMGGVTVNFILGILIFSMSLWYYGDVYLPNKAVINGGGIMATEIGAKVGFQNGDKVTKVNGNEVERFRDLSSPDYLLQESLEYEVIRNGETKTIYVEPEIKKEVIESKGMGLFDYRFKAIVGQTLEGSNAAKGGLQSLDQIVKIDTVPVVFYDELSPILEKYASSNVDVYVKRENTEVKLNVAVDSLGKIGFYPTNELEYANDLDTVKYGFFKAFPEGTKRGVSTLATQVKAFGAMITGKIDASKSVMGPIQMTKLFGPKWDWKRFWFITGLLSLILAFMNLLPIPALDGGHVVFLIIEMIIGRPLSEKFMYAMQIVGMVILFSLMAFVFGVDILSLFK